MDIIKASTPDGLIWKFYKENDSTWYLKVKSKGWFKKWTYWKGGTRLECLEALAATILFYRHHEY